MKPKEYAMRREYRKNTESYNSKNINKHENLIFENEMFGNEVELPQFNLEALARNAAQRVIQQALEDEVSEFLERGKYDKTDAENFTGYRNGFHQKRTVSTAFGGLKVKAPRVSDSPQVYDSQLVKKYKRRSEALDCLFPKLFVEGLATINERAGFAVFSRGRSSTFAIDNFAFEQAI